MKKVNLLFGLFLLTFYSCNDNEVVLNGNESCCYVKFSLVKVKTKISKNKRPLRYQRVKAECQKMI